MNNNFRPLSLSEGFIFEKNNTLLRKFSKNDLTEIYVKLEDEDKINSLNYFLYNTSESQEKNDDEKDIYINENIVYRKSFNIEQDRIKSYSPINYVILVNENNDELNNYIAENNINNYKWSNKIKKLIPSKKKLVYALKKLFMFMIHLSLISIFEIIFFFSIVSIYENEAITGVIINFFNNVPTLCQNFDYEEKMNFTQVFNLLVNTTQIDMKANESAINRKDFNHRLFVNAWMYFLIIIGIDIVLFVIKCLYKIKINFKKIFLENLVMIFILAIYEYMFFTSIILLYKNISQNELIKLIVQQFNMCLV